jgi:Lipocalin-like domain
MKSTLKLALAGAIALSALSFDALAQQQGGQSLQKQLAGQWSLVSAELIDAKGNRGQLVEGADPQGMLVFLDNGRFTLQVISAIPKLAGDRIASTPEESKAVARGVISYWGTYTVNEADKMFTLTIERSSYPNQNGTQARRVIQSLTADELKFGVPARLAGGQNNLAWKRVK